MRTAYRNVCLGAAMLVLAWTGNGKADPALPEQLDHAIRVEVPNGFSGAVLVARGGHIVLDRAYGVERGVRLAPNSRFWIASAGKQFTFAAIMKCAERGWLKLDDPISRFFPNAPADKRAITVLQLLSHLSGLGQSYVSEGQKERTAAVRAMLSEPLIDTPGHAFHYSNSNHQLAVAIVEIASGEDYQEFVRRELLRPAVLRDTGFGTDAGGKAVVPARGDTPARLFTQGWGGEGYYSTTHDLYRWYRALRGARALSPASVKTLFTPVTKISEGEGALGWFIGRTDRGAIRIFTRGNEDWGPNSLLYAYPKTDVVVVVLTHAGNTGDNTTSWSRYIHAKIETALGL